MSDATLASVPPAPASLRRPPAGRLAVGLALLAVLPYLPTLGFEFVGLDDPLYVLQNPHLGHPFDPDFLWWALTGSHDGNWFPFTWFSHAVDLALYGDWAGGHHATNLFFHAASTLGLFAALRRATGSVGRSAVAAALFAVHPLHVESVAWVAERKDVASSAFGFLALWLHVGWAQRGGAGRYLALCAAFAASLASKPMWVTFPCVLLLLDVWPLRRLQAVSASRLLIEKLPLFALSGASSVVTLSVQGGEGAMMTGAGLGLGERILNAVVSLALYLRRIVWPLDLSPFYPHPYLPSEGGAGLSWVQVVGSALLLAVFAALAWRDRRGPVGVGLAWFAGMLVPVLGLVQVGGQGMADRYVYAPLAGALVALVWPAAAWLEERHAERAAPWGIAATTVALALLLALTASQLGMWRDSRSLYEGGLARNPRTQTLRYALAVLERNTGNSQAALAHYRRALEVEPGSARAHNGLGVTYLKMDRLDEARQHFERALEAQPTLSFALNHLATVHRRSGEAALAEERLRQALRVRPGYWAAHRNLIELLHERGRPADAREALEAAARVLPGDPRVAALQQRLDVAR